MILEIYSELCCDFCNEIIHNHFDCPICLIEYAPTDAYLDISMEPPGFVLKCEKCNAQFKLVDASDGLSRYLWEHTNPKVAV